MFAVEIDFHDGISPPETILVRRSNAIIGSSDVAHVVIEGAASSASELRLVRGLGREFSCYPVRRAGQATAPQHFLEGTYIGHADVKLGDLTLHITALDIDLLLGAEEFPDRGSLRILRAAGNNASPLFPAIAVLGPRPLFVSFPERDSLLIGRSRQCGLRLDSADVSNEHARIGVEEGVCWVEDVGSTNGTFVGNEKVSGRQKLRSGERIRLGAEFTLAPVMSETDLAKLTDDGGLRYSEQLETVEYPCVVAYGAEVRPARTVLREGAEFSVGRDPANDIWINAAHISRRHLLMSWHDEGRVKIVDQSSNGTFINGKRMERDIPLLVDRELRALDLSEGVFVGVCFSEADERQFLEGDVRHTAGGTASESAAKPNVDSQQTPGSSASLEVKDPASGDAVFSAEIPVLEDFAASTEAESASQFGEEPREESFAGQFARYAAQSGAQNVENEYSKEFFTEEFFDDEILRQPYFRGVSRALLAVLIVVLIVCTLVLFIGVFSGSKL